jgi:hypothetical protein
MFGSASASTNRPTPFNSFDLRTDRYFSTYNAVVGSYLRAHSAHHRTQACVVGLRDDTYTRAWVIWREGGRLILWQENTEGLNNSVRNLSLTKDIVATPALIGTSTYLESRPWLNKLERLCANHGRRVIVNGSTRHLR